MVDLHRTKGLTGLAAARTYLTCCGNTPHLSVQLSPRPRLTRPRVGQYRERPHFPLLPSPFLCILSSRLTGTCYVDTGDAIPPKKRLSQELHSRPPPSPGSDLVPERGSPCPTVYWTLNGPLLLTPALCCQPRGGDDGLVSSTSLFGFPKFMATNHTCESPVSAGGDLGQLVSP